MIRAEVSRQPHESAPDLERATTPVNGPQQKRSTPTLSFRRVLICYVVTLIAVTCGSAVALASAALASRCTEPGFSCLGYLYWGYLFAGLLAAAVLLVLAVVYRAGAVFWLVTLVMMIVPGLLSGLQPVALAAALLGPGIAAWVAHPPRQTAPSQTILVIRRVTVLAVVVVIAPMLIHVLFVAPYGSWSGLFS